MIKNYLKLLRPEQYVKNLFVFLPAFFSFQLFSYNVFIKVSIVFVTFSAAASVVYIINDIMDMESDRRHPFKKNRPIASGAVPVKWALLLACLLFLSGTFFSYVFNKNLFVIILLYLMMNLLYSFKLKHIPIIDINIIAIGFVLRVFAGAVVIYNSPSMWIIILTYILSLFLAIGKRRDDVLLHENGLSVRKSIDGYNIQIIDSAMHIMATITIMSYLMYTVSPEVIFKMHTDKLYLTIIFVITGLLRYFQIINLDNKTSSPTDILLQDTFLKVIILLWALSFVIIVYLSEITIMFRGII